MPSVGGRYARRSTALLLSVHATRRVCSFSGARVFVDDDGSRDEVRQPSPPLGEQYGHEAGEQRPDREHEPDETNEGSTEGGGGPVRAAHAHAQKPHARRLARGAPEDGEVRARDQDPAGTEERTDEPFWAEASHERRNKGDYARYRHQDDDRERGVGRQRYRACDDPSICCRRGSRRGADDLLRAVVEPRG